MPQEVTLIFETDDEGLNLSGTVNFPNAIDINGIHILKIRGLAEWRHVPANIIHLNKEFVEIFNVTEKSKNLAKIGINWIGLQARSDILLGYSTRQGRNGTKKVQELLTKFFKAIGASSIKFSLVEVEKELDNDDDDYDEYGDDD